MWQQTAVGCVIHKSTLLTSLYYPWRRSVIYVVNIWFIGRVLHSEVGALMQPSFKLCSEVFFLTLLIYNTFQYFFFLFLVVGFWSRKKSIECNSSKFTAHGKEGNHFSQLAVRLKSYNFTFRQMHKRTHTHTVTLMGSDTRVYKTHTDTYTKSQRALWTHKWRY